MQDDLHPNSQGDTNDPPTAQTVSFEDVKEQFADEFTIGDRFEQYIILERLGRGGFGAVYKAEQREPFKRVVALKVINPGVDTREVIARFSSERQALARMDHPNIAKVLDAGSTAAGRPYFVMEYVPGQAITTFADQHKLSIEARLRLFNQVCQAIAHAHQKAIIHRDIKPTNVLAYIHDGEPNAKVIDFGIAKALTTDRLTEQTFNTARGMVVGTYTSMSPEQAAGSVDIDTRSDVYSLGSLLYELLTGVKPFDPKVLALSADQEIRRIIQEVDPPAPSTRLTALKPESCTKLAIARSLRLDELRKKLQIELEWIPLKALRKERDRRYDSVQQLQEDIANYLEGNPLIAGPESRVYRAQKFAHRHRAPLLVAGVLLLTVALGAGGTLVYAAQAQQQAIKTKAAEIEALEAADIAIAEGRRAEEQKAAADAARVRAEAQSLLAQTEAQRSRLANARLQLQLGDWVRARKLLDFTSLPELEAEHRWMIWQYLRETGERYSRDMRPYLPVDAAVTGVLYSGGAKVRLDTDQSRIWAKPFNGNRPFIIDLHLDSEPTSRKASDSENAVFDAVSTNRHLLRDGGWLIPQAPGIALYDANANHQSTWDAQAYLNTGFGRSGLNYLAVNKNESRVAVGTDTGWILVLRLEGDQLTTERVIAGFTDGIGTFEFDDTGRLHVVTENWGYRIIDLDAMPDLEIINTASHTVRKVEFSPDGSRLAAGSYDGGVYVFDARFRKMIHRVDAHERSNNFGDLVFRPGKPQFATTGADSRVTIWDSETGEANQIFKSSYRLSPIAFSQDGALIYLQQQHQVIEIDAKTSEVKRTFGQRIDSGYGYYDLVTSRDGAYLFAASSFQGSSNPLRERIDVFEIATGEKFAALHGHALGHRDMDLSPDGTLLASASRDGTAILWDWKYGRIRHRLSVKEGFAHTNVVSAVCFHPTRPIVATASHDQRVILWSTETGRELATVRVQPGKSHGYGPSGALKDIDFSPDGRTLVAAVGRDLWWIDLSYFDEPVEQFFQSTRPSAITRWDRSRWLDSQNDPVDPSAFEFELVPEIEFNGNIGQARSGFVSADGRAFAFDWKGKGIVIEPGADQARPLKELPVQAKWGDFFEDPERKRVMLWDRHTRKLRVWELENFREFDLGPALPKNITAATWGLDPGSIYIGTQDGFVERRQLDRPDQIERIKVSDQPIHAVCEVRHGGVMAIDYKRELIYTRIAGAEKGKQAVVATGVKITWNIPRHLIASTSGQYFVMLEKMHAVSVWEVTEQGIKQLWKTQKKNSVLIDADKIAISKDDSRIAFGGYAQAPKTGCLSVVDLKTGKTLAQHFTESFVHDIDFKAPGNEVITFGEAPKIRYWKLLKSVPRQVE